MTHTPRRVASWTLVAVVAALCIAPGRIGAQQSRPILTPARRSLVETELAESRVARIKTRYEVVRLRGTHLVGDSIVGERRSAGPDGAPTTFRAHLADVLVIERRNLKRSIGWGVVMGGLVGFVHARALETKDKLDPATTPDNSVYAQRLLLFTAAGVAVGGGVGVLIPAWDLIHARPRL